DLFLEARRQELGSASSKVSTQQDGLSRIDSALQEPGDNGVSAALTKFYNAFSALASGADQPGNLSNVQSAGQTLTDRIRGLYSNLEDERK
ncbi:FlgK family flagellar hook-associated protein, partial [Klebsiella pneumoniae]|uniref:FlgK family flagellar hook-associated protein n=1 Tax=Klebsiella pneumoniae TaxID=573 RepID=UPI003EDECA8E